MTEKRVKIAWMEDDIEIIEPVVKPLKDAGHSFVELFSVEEVIDALDDVRSCDLILLDLLLPVGEAAGNYGRYPGLRLLEVLREQYSIDIPAVVLTMVPNERVLSKLKKLGVADIITKPILPSKLKERVLKALEALHGSSSDPRDE